MSRCLSPSIPQMAQRRGNAARDFSQSLMKHPCSTVMSQHDLGACRTEIFRIKGIHEARRSPPQQDLQKRAQNRWRVGGIVFLYVFRFLLSGSNCAIGRSGSWILSRLFCSKRAPMHESVIASFHRLGSGLEDWRTKCPTRGTPSGDRRTASIGMVK